MFDNLRLYLANLGRNPHCVHLEERFKEVNVTEKAESFTEFAATAERGSLHVYSERASDLNGLNEQIPQTPLDSALLSAIKYAISPLLTQGPAYMQEYFMEQGYHIRQTYRKDLEKQLCNLTRDGKDLKAVCLHQEFYYDITKKKQDSEDTPDADWKLLETVRIDILLKVRFIANKLHVTVESIEQTDVSKKKNRPCRSCCTFDFGTLFKPR